MRPAHVVSVIAAFLVIVLLVDTATPCGMNTHGEVSARGRWHFDGSTHPYWQQILEKHTDALQAGSTFPDWGYSLGYPAESEDAHWIPFIQDASQYVYETYPKPWDTETEKLAVFVQGIASHYIADVNWHTTGPPTTGFIMAQGMQDFDESFGRAHNSADGGGEFLMPYEFDIGQWHSWSYYFPVDDMAVVYQNRGFTDVTPEILRPRCNVLALGGIAGRLGAHLLAPMFARETPFLMEQLTDYFFGGLDDMAVWAGWTWETFAEIMDNGLADIAKAIPPKEYIHDDDKELIQLAMIGYQLIQSGMLEFEQKRTERGVEFIFTPTPALFELTESKSETTWLPEGVDRIASITSDTPYNYTGSALTVGDFNNDGIDDLVMGAHGYGYSGNGMHGQVHVLYGGTEIAESFEQNLSDTPADITLTGQNEGARFGYGLATVDLNADGLDDLAISAPTLDAASRTYSGQVFVYFQQSTGLETTPSLTLTATERNTNLGTCLAAGDLNGDGAHDLVIGSPFTQSGGRQRGQVAVLFSSSPITLPADLAMTDVDILLTGEKNFDWYGGAVAVANWGSDSYLLVGAPDYKRGDVQTVGKIYGYRGADLTQGVTDTSFTLTGANEFDKIGSDFALGDLNGNGHKTLLISAPSATANGQAVGGKVLFFDPTNLSGDLFLENHPADHEINSDEELSRFGWRIAVQDINGDGADELITTAPWHKNGSNRDTGAFYMWMGSDALPTMSNVHWASKYNQPFSLLGVAAAFVDFNHDGVQDIALTASRQNTGGRSAGMVKVLITPVPYPEQVEPASIKTNTRYLLKINGKSFAGCEEIEIRLVQGSTAIEPTGILPVDSSRIDALFDIPTDTPLGSYRLVMENVYGQGALENAVEILQGPDPYEDDDDDDTSDDDDDDNDDTTDKEPSGSDSSDDDDGCGC